MSSHIRKIFIIQTNVPTGTFNVFLEESTHDAFCVRLDKPIVTKNLQDFLRRNESCKWIIFVCPRDYNVSALVNRLDRFLIPVETIEFYPHWSEVKQAAETLFKSILDVRRPKLTNQQTSRVHKFIKKHLFEPNKLSDNEIKNLCYEYLNLYKNQNTSLPPQVLIVKDFEFFKILPNNLLDSTGVNSRVPSLNPAPYPNPLGVYYENGYKGGIGGVYGNNFHFNEIYTLFNETTSRPHNKYTEWFKKTIEVLAIVYLSKLNIFYVLPKPDEWVFEDNNMYYRYGQNAHFFVNKTECPAWIYSTPAEELEPTYYLKIKNADVKAFYLQKIGIERMLSFGTVVDSWENYPENEWWAKSEYKLVDMSPLHIPQTKRPNGDIVSYVSYAPFLYMKNQTTGMIHLEGVHPNCRNLYDALKMRYKMIDFNDIEIKDIK